MNVCIESKLEKFALKTFLIVFKGIKERREWMEEFSFTSAGV